LSCFSIEDVEKEFFIYFMNKFHLDYSSSRILLVSYRIICLITVPTTN